jgi:hypothetical protein
MGFLWSRHPHRDRLNGVVMPRDLPPIDMDSGMNIMQTTSAAQQISNIEDLTTPALRQLIWRKITALFARDPCPDLNERVALEDCLNELCRRSKEMGDAGM